MSELTVSYLDAFQGEPRILDLTVAERLDFVRPRAIRQLIERSKTELEGYGFIATRCGAYRNRQFKEYWLNEAQSLLVCIISRTDKAAEVRRALIDVFTAWRRGQRVPARQPILTRAQLHGINSQAWAIASETARLAYQEHRIRLIKEARDRLAAGLPLDPMLEGKEPQK